MMANNSGRKTAICRYWANNRTCFYGDDCQFLHSDAVSRPTSFSNDFPRGRYHHAAIPRTHSEPNNLQENFFLSGLVGPINDDLGPKLSNTFSSSNNNNSGIMTSPQDSPFFFESNGQFAIANDFNKLNIGSSVNKVSSLEAVEFVPGVKNTKQTSLSLTPPSREFLPGIKEFVPKSKTMQNLNVNSVAGSHMPFHHQDSGDHLSIKISPGSLSAGASPLHSPSEETTSSQFGEVDQAFEPQAILENIGGTTYFFTEEQAQAAHFAPNLPDYNLYPGQSSFTSYLKPKPNAPAFCMGNELRSEIFNRQMLSLAQADPTEYPDIPQQVDNYHNLCPLEPLTSNMLKKSSTFGYINSVYKAVNSKDGKLYCLRRIHGFRNFNQKSMAVIDIWKKIQHSNIVTLREVFTTKAFSDMSLVFAHDYHPGSETLMARQFATNPMSVANGYTPKPFEMGHRKGGKFTKPVLKGPRQHAGLLGESLIWTYVVQLSSALRSIHSAGLACRVMDPTKILITAKSRLRVNCTGIFDILTYDTNQNNPLALMPHYQQEDLVSLGKVVLALACNSVMGIQRENIQASVKLVAQNYSDDLKNLILYLLTNQNRPRSVNDIMPMIGARFYTQLDSSLMKCDTVEEELSKEFQSGRLYRLLCKIGVINERPEFGIDQTWSETGDRYLLKLFRDHLFHQVTDTGAPWIDLAHITQCLNKLDAGVNEKVCLMSRDEQNVLVVSYADLKQCFQKTFSEVLQASTPEASTTQQPSPT